MKKVLASAVALVATAPASFAITVIPGGTPQVPEISALEGTAALAVVAAVVLLAWERRRKSA
ncbi:VPEID-CTERM sorting domain-containing protein [Roseobacter cerasinus]|nr:VPEID-CTERM sorting domain-containing protein [Roseobacter cerasinus]